MKWRFTSSNMSAADGQNFYYYNYSHPSPLKIVPPNTSNVWYIFGSEGLIEAEGLIEKKRNF